MTKSIRFLPLALALLVAGCSDDDGGTEPNPSIAVSLGGAVTVVQGQTGTTQVTVTRGGGFSGAVTLAASGLPVGVTAAFDPATVPAGSGSGTSTLTLTAGPNAPTGAGTFQVTASGGPNLTATTNGSVTITPAPDFSLNVTPNAAAIDQGTARVFNVAITRTGGFTGAVNLSVANLPTGITAAFDNAAPTGNTAVLTLTAAANAAPGPTVLTLNGTGTPGTRSAQFTITVQTPPSSFSLAADPATLSIAQGTDGQTTVTVSKTGSFTGDVALTVTGLPNGVTASFNPASASAPEAAQDEQATSTLTLTAAAGATVGEHPLVIRGNAEGQTEKTVGLTLTVTQPTTSGFTLGLDPATLSVEAGQNGQVTVNINKTGTFTDPVALSVTNLPVGITAAFNPVQASPGTSTDVQTQSTLTLTVANTVAAQDYTLNVRGAAEGQPDDDVELVLTVTPAPGGFTLSANPTSVNIQAGQSGGTTILVNKTGSFTGDVALTVTGLPAGVTASFNPASASPRPSRSASRDVIVESIMTINVGGSVAVDDYTLVVHGNAPGEDEATVNVTLNVTTGGGGSGNSSIKYCDLDDLPIWFAYKDGNGPWTQVTGVVAGDGTTYTFNITQATGAIAYVTGNTSDGFETNVQYATQAQLTGNNGQCPPVLAGTKTLNGSVAGVGATDQVSINMGGSSANGSMVQPAFQLLQVQDGPLDLIAVRNAISFGPPLSITPLGIILRRGLDIANNGTIPVLDFGTAEAFAPATASVTINNAGAEALIASMAYITPTTESAITNALNPTSPVTVQGIPADKQEANDLHQLTVIASNNSGEARGHIEWFKALGNKTVDLGAGLTAPTITSLATAPYVRYSSSGPIQAIYDDFHTFMMTQHDGSQADNRSWTIVVLKGVFTGTNYTMTIEDLTSAGYQALWGLKVGALTGHQTQGVGFSNNGTANPIMEGGTSDFATRVGVVTP